MVSLLHGEDTVASRRFLLSLRNSFQEGPVYEFNGESLPEFVRLSDGRDFFSPRKLVIVEFFKQSIPKQIPYLQYLTGKPETTEVIFWVGSELSARCELLITGQRQGWRVKNFKGFNRRYVFDFVDAVFSRNSVLAFKSFCSILSRNENLFGIISLIVQRLRLLLWSKTNVSFFTNLKPFVRSRVEKQAALFSVEELVEALEKCSQVDSEIKVGALDPSLGIVQIVQRIC